MRSPAKNFTQSGFSKIELAIVLAILVLLAVIGVPQYQAYQAQIRINSTKALHTQIVRLIGSEIVKCSSGAANLLPNTAQQVSCSDNIENIAKAFVVNGNEKNKNPYDSSIPPYSAAENTLNGVTSVIGKGTVITVVTTWQGGTQTATLTKE